jgi:hypothetical protein
MEERIPNIHCIEKQARHASFLDMLCSAMHKWCILIERCAFTRDPYYANALKKAQAYLAVFSVR